ncbi:hypothetical protein KXV95_005538 [Aspergillus fumigatus]|nr:hypothetical protein KXX34_005596 [Aspergillus fumigatus]KAH2834093.1 hypothetical protein KXW76_004094 [Aspergillus fumigatus]KAH3589707.1 hypothetical protein KXV95_005538 [Aspergillus fumigatus]
MDVAHLAANPNTQGLLLKGHRRRRQTRNPVSSSPENKNIHETSPLNHSVGITAVSPVAEA